MVLATRASVRWDEGCEENNLPLSVIPHSTSINMTGRPQTLAVVDDHHCWGHRRGTDAHTCHAPSGALVTNDDSGTSTNHSVSRMSVNTVSEENGDSTKLFLWTIPTVTTREGEMAWTNPKGVSVRLVAGIEANLVTRTNSVATKTMYNVEIVVNSATSRNIVIQSSISIWSLAMKVFPTTVWLLMLILIQKQFLVFWGVNRLIKWQKTMSRMIEILTVALKVKPWIVNLRIIL